MLKNTKNPAQKLTKKDKEILDKILINYLSIIVFFKTEYPNPKDFCNALNKQITSKTKTAYFHSFIFIKNDILPKSFKPSELNTILASQISDDIYQFAADEDSSESYKSNQQFIDSTILNESILEKMKDRIGLENVKGKKEVRKHYLKQKEKNISKQKNGKPSGRPSIYFVLKDIEDVKKTLDKPKSMEYLQNKMIKFGIMKELSKYFSPVIVHIITSNEELIIKIADFAKMSLCNSHLNEQEIEFAKEQYKKYHSYNEQQKESLVKEMDEFISKGDKDNNFYKATSFFLFVFFYKFLTDIKKSKTS